MKKVGFLLLTVGILFLDSRFLYAASTSANALITVIKQLSIVKVNDLQFNERIQGDPSETVAPGDAGAASFTVTGQANRAVTINLPVSANMEVNGGGTADKTIVVNSFAHDQGGSPVLDGSGNMTLKVGATHAAIRNTQDPGNYSGTFTVEVTY